MAETTVVVRKKVDKGGEEEEEEEDVQERRRRARERARQEEAEAAAEAEARGRDNGTGASSSSEEDESGSEEEDSDDEDDSDDDDELGRRGRTLLKPIFVPSRARQTAGGDAGGTKTGGDDRDDNAVQQAAAEERRAETRAEVAALMERERQFELQDARENATGHSKKEDVITDDEAEGDDDLEAILAWEGRERERILRDSRLRRVHTRPGSVAGSETADAAAGGYAAARAARPKSTLREIEASFREYEKYDRRGGRGEDGRGNNDSEQKQKYGFMQRYYHKGAFFQDDADDAFAAKSIKSSNGDDVLDRDYASARTGEDKFFNESLPAVMQVRNFGRIGQTKYRGLKNEDTSRSARDDDWYKIGSTKKRSRERDAGPPRR